MEAMHDAGYETALFHSGFLSYLDESFLFEKKGMGKVVDASEMWKGNEQLPWSWGVREEQTVDALCGWIAQRGRGGDSTKPFFVIYSTEFPHHPYACPIDDKPYPQTTWLNRYRNSLHYADKSIGTLLDRLAAGKLLDRTLIVVVGDHGETVSTYPVGHGLALTREEVYTPLIISNPTIFPTALTSRLSTNHLDIAPTVAALLGAKPSPQWLGRNLLAEQMPARVLFIQAKLAQIHGVIDNGLLYVYESGRRRGQLFDTSSPGPGNWPTLSPTEAKHATLMDRYHALDETFQKWAVWRHLARASGQLDEALRDGGVTRQRNAAVTD
jgi:arylsulfatase A-like enzyme